jgi:hypothetical protein
MSDEWKQLREIVLTSLFEVTIFGGFFVLRRPSVSRQIWVIQGEMLLYITSTSKTPYYYVLTYVRCRDDRRRWPWPTHIVPYAILTHMQHSYHTSRHWQSKNIPIYLLKSSSFLALRIGLLRHKQKLFCKCELQINSWWMYLIVAMPRSWSCNCIGHTGSPPIRYEGHYPDGIGMVVEREWIKSRVVIFSQ